MKYTESIWKPNFCNECNSTKDAKIIQIGNFHLTLCLDCRKTLNDLLQN